MVFDKILDTINSVKAEIGKTNLNNEVTFINNYPVLSKGIIINYLDDLSEYLESNEFSSELKEDNPIITNFKKLLNAWNQHSIKNGLLSNQNFSCIAGYSLVAIIYNLKKELSPYIDKDSADQIQKRFNIIKSQCKSIESQMTSWAKRFDNIENYISSIEGAYDVSQKMPVTMEELESNSKEIKDIRSSAEETNNKITDILDKINSIYIDVNNKQEVTSNLLLNAQNALGMATNASLASSFSKRTKELSTESNWWLVILGVSLVITLGLGIWRINELMKFLGSDSFSTGAVISNIILSIVICSAPFWGAWFATRRLGYLFKLKEDYAYKAATAIAFEGYRDKAEKYDGDIELQVFKSVLQRFEEAPLRLLTDPIRSSPISEFLNSKALINFIKQNPSKVKKVLEEIENKDTANNSDDKK